MTEITPVHLLPDSERLLMAHGQWHAPWDGSDQAEEPDMEELVQDAFNLYARGLLPIQVRWQLAKLHSSLPVNVLRRAQRGAERALLAADSASAELRRAMVAAARQTAIQGALADGQWGAALRGLERAGEIVAELRESAGLSEDDLRLTVVVESLPPAEGEPVRADVPAALTPETVETEA
jgi:hypothetical protein